MRLASLAFGMLIALSPSVLAGTIEGRAIVIDGDTLDVEGIRIRLHGIDAPETRQFCTLPDGPWPCGRHATQALASHIGGRPVVCEELGRDRYRRVVGSCTINGADIEAWMVREGLALAYRRYSQDYLAEENFARNEKRGLWAGQFMAPWEWRQVRRAR